MDLSRHWHWFYLTFYMSDILLINSAASTIAFMCLGWSMIKPYNNPEAEGPTCHAINGLPDLAFAPNMFPCLPICNKLLGAIKPYNCFLGRDTAVQFPCDLTKIARFYSLFPFRLYENLIINWGPDFQMFHRVT
jgi:hypothetical protein